MTRIETARLCLRDYTPADLPAMLTLQTAPQTRYYDTETLTEAQVGQFLQRVIDEAAAEPRTHYHLAVCPREAPQTAFGLVKLVLNYAPVGEWEVGWALLPAYWGQGYALEAARAMLDLAFGPCRAHRVVAFSHAANAASIRVMERLGMQHEGTLRETRRWQNQWADEVVYGLLEREWGG
ncbi:MAG: GNAT family N-acetyltransferase [Anaerolineae bacterium]|nr:GNAT family N-acetyltransferase [Anaerolineae bacterium]